MQKLELIKVEVKNGEQLVSARELHELLKNIEEFKEFFICVSEFKTEFTKENLKILLKELDNEYYYEKFGEVAILYLRDSILCEGILPCKNNIEEKFSERDMQKYIIKNFENIFPEYEYLGQEVEVDKIGRIDILAKVKNSDTKVIIELKLGNKNPNTQLLAYAHKYKNPILIAITEKPTKKIKDIKYLLWSDIK